jgi:hypothetical protein
MPATLVGLVLFVAGAGPGYLYVRLRLRHTPREAGRSQLEEAAEYAVFGALASGLALLATLTLGEATNLLDTGEISNDPGRYAATEPARSLLALALVLALSYGAVALATTAAFGRGRGVITPGETAWYAAFHRMLPEHHGVYATLELRDGRAVAGLVAAYTPEFEERREIVLLKPVGGQLYERTLNGEAQPLPDTFLVIQGADVLSIAGRYTPVTDS